MPKHPNPFIHFLNILWSIFLSGLFTLLPITITVALFNFSFKLIMSWLSPLHTLIEPTRFGNIPYIEIVLVAAFILIVGVITQIFVLRSLIKTLERLFAKIPMIRPIYSGIKQLVDAFNLQNKLTFKQVVIVEFPREGIYSLGFMTSELPAELAPNNKERFYNVFIPTTPNPTSGFFVITAEHNLKPSVLTRQEAMAMIISGGIIQPDRFHDEQKN